MPTSKQEKQKETAEEEIGTSYRKGCVDDIYDGFGVQRFRLVRSDDIERQRHVEAAVGRSRNYDRRMRPAEPKDVIVLGLKDR